MSSPEQFIRLLDVIGRTGATIRFCRGNEKGFTAFGVDRDNLQEAFDIVDNLNENAWFEVQPTLYDKPFGRSSEADIVALGAVYADIDFKATDGSKPGMGSEAAALELVDAITRALGTGPSAMVWTGHGVQPYWPVVADDDGIDIKKLLRRFGMLVQTLAVADGGFVDNVFDLPRILRIPGVMNRKDQKHWVETRAEFDPQEPIGYAELDEILDDWGVEEPRDVEQLDTIVSPEMEWEWAEQDCDWVATVAAEIRSSHPTARHAWLLKWAATIHGMIRGTCLTEQSFYDLRNLLVETFSRIVGEGANPRQMVAGEAQEAFNYGLALAQMWSKEKLAAELRHHFHKDLEEELHVEQEQRAENLVTEQIASNLSSIFTGAKIDGPVDVPLTASTGSAALALSKSTIDRVSAAGFTDTGNAEQLANVYKGRFIYVTGIGWHRWDDGQYVKDVQEEHVEAAKDLFVNMAQGTGAMAEWARKSLSSAKLAASVKLAQSVRDIRVDPIDMDSEPEELCTPGGIVDLRTGVLREADPSRDFNTRRTSYTPNPDMDISGFMTFMYETLKTDDMVSYMQRLMGAAAIGEVRWHTFPNFIGVGANGKSVLIGLMFGCFGSYAAMMPPKFLTSANGETHQEAIARLRGIRAAFASEVPPNARFEEDLVKTITGEGTLTGRNLYEPTITFKNTTTLFLAANHLPTVSSGGSSFWRRLRKIDFRHVVPLAKQNPMLVQQLLAKEGPGILAWVIEGAREIIATGTLNEPKSVIASTDEYESEEDTVGRFLEDTVRRSETQRIGRDELFSLYQQWAYQQGIKNPLLLVKFGREVRQRLDDTLQDGPRFYTHIERLPPEITYAAE